MTRPEDDARNEDGFDTGTPGGEPARERELRPQGRRTVQRLLDAGREVFTERGFHAARIDDIVARAETSHGTFYLYFANKDDLLAALTRAWDRAVDELAEQLQSIPAGVETRQHLHAWVSAFRDLYETHGAVVSASAEAEPSSREGAERARARVERLATSLSRRVQQHGPDDLDPDAAGLALIAMIERFVFLHGGTHGDDATDHPDGLRTVSAILHHIAFANAS